MTTAFRHKPRVTLTPELKRRISYYAKNTDELSTVQIANYFGVSVDTVERIKRGLNEEKETNTQEKD